LADHIAAYKMSNADRTKAEKERKVYESNQSKEERKKEQSVRLIGLKICVDDFIRKFNVNFRKRKKPAPKRKPTKRMIPRRRCKKKLLKRISL